MTDGKTYPHDNPLILANRKAKRLASVLRKQSSIVKSKARVPWIEPLIFLSSTNLKCKLVGSARARVYRHGHPGTVDDPGIVGALSSALYSMACQPLPGRA
jgi:hypothetical protein